MIKKELHNAYTLMKNRRNLFVEQKKWFHYQIAMLKGSIRHHIEINPKQIKSLSPRNMQSVTPTNPPQSKKEDESEYAMKISSLNIKSSKPKEEKHKINIGIHSKK